MNDKNFPENGYPNPHRTNECLTIYFTAQIALKEEIEAAEIEAHKLCEADVSAKSVNIEIRPHDDAGNSIMRMHNNKRNCDGAITRNIKVDCKRSTCAERGVVIK